MKINKFERFLVESNSSDIKNKIVSEYSKELNQIYSEFLKRIEVPSKAIGEKYGDIGVEYFHELVDLYLTDADIDDWINKPETNIFPNTKSASQY